MDRIGAREARLKFADVLNRAAFAKNRIVFTKNGKDVAALVPIEDLRALEDLEDRADSAAARRILASNPRTRKLVDVIAEDTEARTAARKRVASHR
jgi:prevent-host-death family protein